MTEIQQGTLQLKPYSPAPSFVFNQFPLPAPTTPSAYFGAKFPEQQEQYGPAILEAVTINHEGSKEVNPVSINEDFFGGVLGGQKSLKHKVAFFTPEQTWYFFDPRLNLFTPTIEEKLKMVISQLFICCAQQMPRSVNIGPLFNEFRSEEVLRKIVKRGKALLAAEASFFSPQSPHARAQGGEIHERIARLFLKQAIKPEPQHILTVRQCFELFCEFSKACGVEPVNRRHFRPMLADLIREEFDLGFRKDLLGPENKFAAGWKGLCAQLPVHASRLQQN